jgi:hypothetical protein
MIDILTNNLPNTILGRSLVGMINVVVVDDDNYYDNGNSKTATKITHNEDSASSILFNSGAHCLCVKCNVYAKWYKINHTTS